MFAPVPTKMGGGPSDPFYLFIWVSLPPHPPSVGVLPDQKRKKNEPHFMLKA